MNTDNKNNMTVDLSDQMIVRPQGGSLAVTGIKIRWSRLVCALHKLNGMIKPLSHLSDFPRRILRIAHRPTKLEKPVLKHL
jgi:hypothetical protein